MPTGRADRDTVTRLAVQHVLTTMRLDAATNDRIIDAMTPAEQEELLAGAQALADQARRRLDDTRCPTCRSVAIRPLYPVPCPDTWHDRHQAQMRAQYPNCAKDHPPCWNCAHGNPCRA
jgi:hypothetical protein